MSEIFFRELGLPRPDYNLEVGSGSHGQQTGEMMIKLEKILLQEKPSLVLIYGDTNSTVAGALSAVKLHIPVAHVEAGMRSFNREMPEEINRVVADHLSQLLFCPTRSSVKLLKKEGITRGVYFVGDVMADIFQSKVKKQKSKVLEELNLKSKEYILATVHRQENTDSKENLNNILAAFIQINQTIIFPIHPRTKKYFKEYRLEALLKKNPQIRLIEPVGFAEMMILENNAKMILTDSGGVQKEAYLARVPCVTLRKETEWTETALTGWNRLAGTDVKKIIKWAQRFPKPKSHPNFLGNGRAYQKITKTIRQFLDQAT